MFLSFKRSKTLSIATCVEPQSKTRFPCFDSWQINSKIIVVLPEPGGPSSIAKSGVDSAFSTNSLCSSFPLLFSSVKTIHSLINSFLGSCQFTISFFSNNLIKLECSATGIFCNVKTASNCLRS